MYFIFFSITAKNFLLIHLFTISNIHLCSSSFLLEIKRSKHTVVFPWLRLGSITDFFLSKISFYPIVNICFTNGYVDNVFCRYDIVIYWPSIEASIKRSTWVNKWKNSRSRWTLENIITRCPDGSSQLETGCRTENQLQTEGFRPLVIPAWATHAKIRKTCCYGWEKNLGQYSSLSLVSTHFSHTTNITPFRNKVWEIYIFIKKSIRWYWSRHYELIMFPCIFVCA